jgi:hypothetical protein
MIVFQGVTKPSAPCPTPARPVFTLPLDFALAIYSNSKRQKSPKFADSPTGRVEVCIEMINQFDNLVDACATRFERLIIWKHNPAMHDIVS